MIVIFVLKQRLDKLNLLVYEKDNSIVNRVLKWDFSTKICQDTLFVESVDQLNVINYFFK